MQVQILPPPIPFTGKFRWITDWQTPHLPVLPKKRKTEGDGSPSALSKYQRPASDNRKFKTQNSKFKNMDNPFSPNSSDPAERAKALLTHYLIQSASGFAPETEDSLSEISNLVTYIIDAAVESATSKLNQEIQTLRNKVSALENEVYQLWKE